MTLLKGRCYTWHFGSIYNMTRYKNNLPFWAHTKMWRWKCNALLGPPSDVCLSVCVYGGCVCLCVCARLFCFPLADLVPVK